MQAVTPVEQATQPETAEVFNRLNAEMNERDRKAAKAPRRFSPAAVVFVGLAFAAGFGVSSLVAARRANAPIAIVNGEAITAPEFSHRMETATNVNGAVGPAVLRQMIAEKLQLQLAAKQGVTPPDADVEAKYAAASKQAGFDANLKASHQTPEDIKNGLRVNLAQQALVGKGVTVSDDDIQKFYQTNTDPKNSQARYYRPEAVQIAVIITNNPADVQGALHDLASGAAWAQVATKYSKDQSKANGGVLPAIRRGQMDAKKFPGLEAKFFAMKPGQQLDNVQAGGATWIVRCVGKQTEERVPFEKVRDECRTGAMLTKGLNANGQNLQAQTAAFQKEAKIEIVAPQYQDAIKQ